MSGIGNFSLEVNASNLLTWQYASIWLPVQIAITNFAIVQPPVLPFDQINRVYFAIDTGSHVELVANIDGTNTQVYYNATTNTGYIEVTAGGLSIGHYALNVTADNLVAPPSWTDHVVFHIDYVITDVNVTEVHRCLQPGTVNVFNVTLKWASR